jgi:hypothetical protein
MPSAVYAEGHKLAPNAECSYAECHYAECRYPECRGAHSYTWQTLNRLV